MRVTFVSNYINHHQIPLSNELYDHYGDHYVFLQTEKVEEERLQMGWSTEGQNLPYVENWDDDPEGAKHLLLESDVVIFGGTEREELILPRLEAGKFTIRYSESIYKSGRYKFISPRGLRRKYRDHGRFRNDPVYMLCAGAYVAGDFSLIHAYPRKKLQWGYFPECKTYKQWELAIRKRDTYEEDHRFQLLWSGRQIDWKHPEMAVKIAANLKEKGYPILLTMIGDGPMRKGLEELAGNLGLGEDVRFLDFMPPEEVRHYMEQTHLYLFTSDRKEGWGVVCAEAMNSGCAVLASEEAGASRVLIRHGENGMLYPCRNFKKACKYAEDILHYNSLRKKLGEEAYRTITEEWNPHIAAKNLIHFMEKGVLPDHGPVSPVRNYW